MKFMRIPQRIDRILELGEAIFRYYFWAHSKATLTPDGKIAPPPEEAILEAHLRSLSPGELYLSIVALEIGRQVLHPAGLMAGYLAASGAFPRHCDAVERLMKDPQDLARSLDSGLFTLREMGVDIEQLFQPGPMVDDPPLE